MQNKQPEKKPEERKRVSKFSDAIPPNAAQLLKEFEDSFKEKAPTQFVRGGFIGSSDSSLAQEKGQLYEMTQNSNVIPNPNQNLNNTFFNNAPKFSAAQQNMSFIPPQSQFSGQNIYGNFPNITSQTQDSSLLNSTLEKNKQEADKKNLKGRSLIQEIIQDTEISMTHSGKDNEKNSNLYLCNLSPFITEEILTREFGIYGKIESIKIIPPKCDTIKHFIAFINFSNAESAENALIAKQNKIILGQPVKIKYGKKITPTLVPVQPLVPPSIQIPTQPIANNMGLPVQNQISIPGQPPAAPFIPHAEAGFGQLPQQLPHSQAAYGNNLPPYPYTHFYPPQATPAFQLHPQLLVYPPPNPNFPMQQMYSVPHLYVKFPDNLELRKKIDEISLLVFKEGYITEQTLMQRERLNPEYSFMIYPNTEENNYYRWRVFSLFQGDSLTNWRKEPFQMHPGGVIWVPPIIDPLAAALQQQIETEKIKAEENLKKEKDAALLSKIKENAFDSASDEDSSDLENDEEEKEIMSKNNQIGKVPLTTKKSEIFNELLKNVNLTKKEIKIVLIFCYENVKSAEEIIETIFKFLKESKNYNNKIVYLYLISDLLYNSKNSNIFNSWCYKKEIELILPDVFEEFNQFYLSFEGRISSESLKDKVANLIRIWKGWQIFEEEYYTGLELTLLKKKRKSEKENPQYNNAIKAELEEYEDELLEIISENPEELKAKAKEMGVSIKGELTDIISKLVYLKEQKLISEFQSKEKKENEKNIANKFKEKICELDITIENLKIVLESMQKSYKKIRESDIDGLAVDIVEYKYMNFEDLDEEINMLQYANARKISDDLKSQNKLEKNAAIKSPGKIINTSNVIVDNEKNKVQYIADFDDDIDGEPI